MTMVLKLDLDMVKMPLCVNEVPHLSGLEVSLNRQIQTQTDSSENIMLPPTRMVITMRTILRNFTNPNLSKMHIQACSFKNGKV